MENLLEIALKGGWIMGVLFVLSIISLALFIERWITTKKATRFEEKTYIEILRMIDQKKSDEAAKICKLSETPICKIMEQGLDYAATDLNLATETIDQSANQFVRGLEKHLNTISTLAAIAPLVGFLGTVIGMIQVFKNMEEAGGTDISMFSSGIWMALVTTVGGLIVGIMCIIFHNYLVGKIENIAYMIEAKITQVTVHLRRTQ
jgi:biopolymer transport protein ExbB